MAVTDTSGCRCSRAAHVFGLCWQHVPFSQFLSLHEAEAVRLAVAARCGHTASIVLCYLVLGRPGVREIGDRLREFYGKHRDRGHPVQQSAHARRLWRPSMSRAARQARSFGLQAQVDILDAWWELHLQELPGVVKHKAEFRAAARVKLTALEEWARRKGVAPSIFVRHATALEAL